MYSELYTYITQGWAMELFWMLTETCYFSVLSINYQLDRQVILYWSFFFKILKGHEVFTVTSLASCFYNHVAWHGVQYSENCTVIPLYTVQTHGLIHPKQGKVLCKSNTENILLFCYYSVLKPQKTHQWFWYDYIKGYELNVQHTFYFNLSSQAKGQETKSLQLWQLVDPFE